LQRLVRVCVWNHQQREWLPNKAMCREGIFFLFDGP